MPLKEGQDMNFGANIFQGAALLWVQCVDGIVAGLRIDIGAQTADFGVQTWTREDENRIDTAERGEEVGAVFFGIAGASGSFQRAHGGIAVDRDEQSMTQGGGLCEVAGMAAVEEVETTVG